jgi:hypothetical protein
MTESDGKNESQLIDVYIRNVLVYRALVPPGSPLAWLTDTEGSALTVWLLWMTVNRGI